VGAQHLGGGGGGPRQAAGQHQVEEQAQRIHVGGRADHAAADAFRRQVRGRPVHLAADAVRLPGARRDAEVDQLHAVRGDHHVAGLHVAMHDAAGVRGAQRVGHLRADRHRGTPRQRALGQQIGQRPAVDQLHHHERQAVLGLAEVVHLDHVRVAQPGGGARLDPDPVQQHRVGGRLRGQHLDRDLPVEHLVTSPPDHRHAAGAEPLGQPVSAGHSGHHN